MEPRGYLYERRGFMPNVARSDPSRCYTDLLAVEPLYTVSDIDARIARLEKALRSILEEKAVPINQPHAAAENGKALLRAQNAARNALLKAE